MKKIIAILVVALAFGLNANAQQTKVKATASAQQTAVNNDDNIKQAVLKDINMLMEVVELNEDQQKNLKQLFEYKHKTLTLNGTLSQERKDNLAQGVEIKLKGSLTADQVAKLDQNPTLLKKLTR